MNPGFDIFVAVRRTVKAVRYLNGRLFIVGWSVNLVICHVHSSVHLLVRVGTQICSDCDR
jgi:hypothetical protein